MSTVIKYSIVRFRPFAETGEFANVGVILLRVSDGVMRFRLAPKRFPRVKNFFDESAYKAYEDAISIMELEFSRLTDFLPHFPNFRGADAFNELVKIRESSVIFSEPRLAEVQEDLDEAVERLFGRFVRREAISQTREGLLTRNIRRALKNAGVRGFHSVRLDDDLVPVNFPLAIERGALKAIKPLAFSQKAPLSVLDHGAHWRRRFDILLSKGKLREGNVLIALEPPQLDDEGSLMDAYRLAVEEIRKLPFEVVEAGDADWVQPEIIEFAKRVSGVQWLFN